MKIILSRKGFDSASGKQPNPIMPDSTLLSLPIPSEKDDRVTTYSSLSWNGRSYYDIIHSLKPKSKIMANDFCHLDPDIRKDVCSRPSEWIPAFGQVDSALTHLRNQQVSIGDIFLFFGWFKATEERNGTLVYKKGAPDLHIIYGYMQIGEIINKEKDVPQWLMKHPHASYRNAWNKNLNAIFLPSDKLSVLPNKKGCDTLDYRENRVLTMPNMPKGRWNLPQFFRNVPISYHPNPWRSNYFQSAGRGQEFVMEATPEVLTWAKQIIE